MGTCRIERMAGPLDPVKPSRSRYDRRMSARGTRALEILRSAGATFSVHEYERDEPPGAARGERVSYGEATVAALGLDPARVFKTLVASVDGRLVVGVVPVAGELDLKRLADAVGGRKAAMADPAEAERATGYVVGGISPLGQRRRLPVVIDRSVEDFATVVRMLDGAEGFAAYELNVSCPNTRQGGLEFGADREALRALVGQARAETRRPLFVKLSPTLPDIAGVAQAAVDAGADAISVVNTIPGLVIDVQTRRPALGFGTGGVSGPGLRPVGVLATWKVRRALPDVPILGLGGVSSADLAGAEILSANHLLEAIQYRSFDRDRLR